MRAKKDECEELWPKRGRGASGRVGTARNGEDMGKDKVGEELEKEVGKEIKGNNDMGCVT